MKSRNLILSLLTLGGLASGCDAFLAIPISPQLIESKNLVANEASVQLAVDGIYAHLRGGNPRLANGAVSIFAGLAADELRPTAISPTYDPFHGNALLPTTSHILSTLWTPGYQSIYRCNTLIAALRADNPLPSAAKHRFLGELLVARALQYSYLAGLFGDVPLVLETDYAANATMSRTPYADVMRQVADDLHEAMALLPTGQPAIKSRPSHWAAAALLARICLYLGNHAQAIELSGKVIDGPFSLHPTLAGIFLIGGVETVWEIAQPSSSGNTPEGGAFLPSSPTRLPAVALNPSVVDLFEAQDLRLANWVGISMAGREPVHHPRKYTHPQAGEIREYAIILRIGEQYLIRAEAYLASGREDLARQDLNVIRGRAGTTPLMETVAGEALWAALRDERQRELFSEWGHRWFDLRRWGIIDAVMSAAKPGWKPYTALFPIPETQLLYNFHLTQNPGY